MKYEISSEQIKSIKDTFVELNVPVKPLPDKSVTVPAVTEDQTVFLPSILHHPTKPFFSESLGVLLKIEAKEKLGKNTKQKEKQNKMILNFFQKFIHSILPSHSPSST